MTFIRFIVRYFILFSIAYGIMFLLLMHRHVISIM